MIRPKLHHRERQYRPLAGKTLRPVLIRFVSREFPRLGGPWVVELFVDKLLEIMAKYRIAPEQLRPGQTLWPAIALDERPAYRKPTSAMRQVPVVITQANQNDVNDLRNNANLTDVLKRALARAAKEAFAQGGVLTITHKRIICRMAYPEGKPTHRIAQETRHSPEAVDNYILDFARIHFATVKRGMTPEETAFAIQRPLYLVQEYVNLIQEFGMDEQRIYDRSGIDLVRFTNADEEPEALPQPAALALDST